MERQMWKHSPRPKVQSCENMDQSILGGPELDLVKSMDMTAFRTTERLSTAPDTMGYIPGAMGTRAASY